MASCLQLPPKVNYTPDNLTFDDLCEFGYTQCRNRGVAQLVARIVWDDEVDGSSPFAPTISKPYWGPCGCANEKRQPRVGLPFVFCDPKDRYE